jgi:hypothetical protein
MSDTVFVPLLGEGVPVWRPVAALRVSEHTYVIADAASSDEEWQFAPGSTVRCEPHTFQDGSEGLVAVEQINAK